MYLTLFIKRKFLLFFLFQFVFFIARNIVATRANYFGLAINASQVLYPWAILWLIRNLTISHKPGRGDVYPLPTYVCCHAISKIPDNEQISSVSSDDTCVLG